MEKKQITNMGKLKLISIGITIVCIAILASLYYFPKKSTYQPTPPTKVTKKLAPVGEICNVFSEPNKKNLCLVAEEKCKKSIPANPDVVQCVAYGLVRNVSREDIAKICQLKKNEGLQHYCTANALLTISLNKSLKECDLINATTLRYFCRADQKQKTGETNEALLECENIKNSDEMHFCKASFVYVETNKTLAKKECELIKDKERMNECFNKIGI